MFLNIQVNLLMSKTYDGRFTSTTKTITAYHLSRFQTAEVTFKVAQVDWCWCVGAGDLSYVG